jgi:hypothetical protein
MAERSKFEKMGDSQLRKYAAYVEKVLEGQGVLSDINDFYQLITYNIKPSLVKKITSPVGGLSRTDIEYLFYVIANNFNLEDEGTLDRPRLENTTVDYVYDEKVYRRVRRTGRVLSYLGSDLTSPYLVSIKSEDEIDPWEWNVTDEQEDDWDIMSDWFDV